MALGRRRREGQEGLFVARSAIRSSGNPFYEALNVFWRRTGSTSSRRSCAVCSTRGLWGGRAWLRVCTSGC